MPRTAKCRLVCRMPAHCRFTPEAPSGEPVALTVEEYEAVRLMDYLGQTQEEAAAQMGVARTTVQRIYAQARKKLAVFLVEGRSLQIGGGSYVLCPRQSCHGCGGARRVCQEPTEKGNAYMKIAATYENGAIFPHFGHTEQFKLYTVEDGKVISSQVVPTNGSGHGALAGFLSAQGVDSLICGGIGGGAQMALAEAGIRLYAGCAGDADQRVEELLAGTLAYAESATCDHHHGEDHACGDHGCGEHDHSCGGRCGQ